MSRPFADIAPWPPVRYTPPLSAEFRSVFDLFRDVIVLVWRNAFGYEPEAWQIELVRAITEIYPRGHRRAGQLRWREAVISLGRQNGKTEIAAMVGLLVLMWKARAQIVGLATSADQARLIYKRTMDAIKGTARLAAKFRALTETRGIHTNTGGVYEIKAAKSDALQGIPLDAGLVDELHILAMELWTDMVNGLGGRADCIVVGITTAGDEDSALLKRLYERGAEAIARGDDARLGFWLWEAPEARVPDDDETLGRFLAYANPAVACGRVDLENAIEETRGAHESSAVRYRLNRFVASESAFLPLDAWLDGHTSDPFPAGARPIFTFDRTPGWEYGSVGMFAKLEDGTTYCELVYSLVRPTLEQFADIAAILSRYNPITFGMDGFSLRDLGRELERRGLPVTITTQNDAINAASLFYAKVVQRKVKHPGHPLLSMQIPRAVRKNMPDGGFKISRAGGEIDALMSHVLGVHLAETRREVELQIF